MPASDSLASHRKPSNLLSSQTVTAPVIRQRQDGKQAKAPLRSEPQRRLLRFFAGALGCAFEVLGPRTVFWFRAGVSGLRHSTGFGILITGRRWG